MLSRIKQFFTIEVDLASRVYGFDIMRGIGILIVVYAHGRSKMHFFPRFNDFVSVIGFWLMDLFFVLSGFLIGMILIKFYVKEKTFSWSTAYNFWIRRWFRTLPNYYLVLFLTAGLWALGGNIMFFKLKFLMYALFCQTVVLPPNYFLMESWTLCIEEWFYLLFPILLLVVNKIFFSQEDNAAKIKRNILVSIIVFFIVPILLRILLYVKHSPLIWLDFSRMTFFRMDTIAIGIFMSWVNFYYKDFFKKYRNPFGIFFIILITLYLLYFYMILLPDLKSTTHQTSFFAYTLFFVLSSAAALCLTVYMKEVQLKQSTLFARFITMISLISYSLYIFHRSVVMYIIDELFIPKTTIENILLFVVYVVISILFSIVVYKFFEYPMTELREKLKR